MYNYFKNGFAINQIYIRINCIILSFFKLLLSLYFLIFIYFKILLYNHFLQKFAIILLLANLF